MKYVSVSTFSKGWSDLDIKNYKINLNGGVHYELSEFIEFLQFQLSNIPVEHRENTFIACLGDDWSNYEPEIHISFDRPENLEEINFREKKSNNAAKSILTKLIKKFPKEARQILEQENV